MKYLDESIERHSNKISESYIKKHKMFTDDFLEYHIENYYNDNPIPIEQRPTVWINVSNLLNKHYELQSK